MEKALPLKLKVMLLLLLTFLEFLFPHILGLQEFGTKYSNPATSPTGSGRGVAFL
jgi:hypothetical protein